jgi:ribose transport system ATP-binding protein
VSIIYISHFLEECQALCDRYTVLRDGESVGSGPHAGAISARDHPLMVGREVTEIYPRMPHPLGEPVLEVRNLAEAVRNPLRQSFSLRAGEILGIAGLVGAGRTETLRAIFGLDEVRGGEVTRCWPGAFDRASDLRGRLDQGIGLLSEDRKEEGLLLGRSLADNLTLTRLGPVSPVRAGERPPAARRRDRAMDEAGRPGAGPGTGDRGAVRGQPAEDRDRPTAASRRPNPAARRTDPRHRRREQGPDLPVDRRTGGQGRAVVFVSSYLPELLGVCDTIGVMCRGTLVDVRPVERLDRARIMAAAIGQAAGQWLARVLPEPFVNS